MTTPDPTLHQRYADVLGRAPDAALVHLVADLDALATAPPLPAPPGRAPPPPTLHSRGHVMMFPDADPIHATPGRPTPEGTPRRGRIAAATLAVLIVLASAILFATVRGHGGPASGGPTPIPTAPGQHVPQTPTVTPCMNAPTPTPTPTAPGQHVPQTPTVAPCMNTPTPTAAPGATPAPTATTPSGGAPTATPYPTQFPPTPTPTPRR
jgi:hypothetical protein